jgi:hypothetical protein
VHAGCGGGRAGKTGCAAARGGGSPATLELAQGRLGVVDLLHDKLSEPLANQERKKKGQRVLSFTGGGVRTEAAALRASGAPGT